jgi:Amidohydrolase
MCDSHPISSPVSSADFQPYVDHALEVFGPHRLMYGGDWPFALLAAGSYTQIWAGIRVCLDRLDPEALWAVLGGTARRVYGLPASDRRVRERPQAAGREHLTAAPTVGADLQERPVAQRFPAVC